MKMDAFPGILCRPAGWTLKGVFGGALFSILWAWSGSLLAVDVTAYRLLPPGDEMALPLETLIAIKTDDAGVTHALVTAVFSDSGHEVTSWGDVQREGNRLEATITIVRHRGIVLPVLTERSHTYSLGHLEPGYYLFAVFSAGHQLAAHEFRVPGMPTPEPPAPARVNLVVNVRDGRAVAVASVLFTEDGWIIRDWGTPMRLGNHFSISVTAERIDRLTGDFHHDGRQPTVEALRKYDLGLLDPGDYQLTFLLNSVEKARRMFAVRADGEGDVTLRADPVTDPGELWQTLLVIYRHPAGVDVSSIGGDEIRVTGPHGYDRFARLVNVVAGEGAADPPATVTATYRVYPPGRRWTHRDNGHYAVRLLPRSVRAADGTYFAGQRLGRFVVNVPEERYPLPHFGSVEIIRHDAGDGILRHGARLTILVPASNIIVTSWGEIHRRGNRFAVDVRLNYHGEVGATVIRDESHTYPLGALAPGGYLFTVYSRGHFIGRHAFTVEGDGGPRANVGAGDITEAHERPHLIRIRYWSPNGMNLDSIREAPVVVSGPLDYRHRARLLRLDTYTAERIGQEFVQAVYSAPAPVGGWTHHHNGSYGIYVPHGAILDNAGQALPGGRIGGFRAMIPEPHPHPGRPWFALTIREDGEGVFADVEFHPGNTPLIATRWGELRLRGDHFVAPVEIINGAIGDVAPRPRHTHRLGRPAPGVYGFVIHSIDGRLTSRHWFSIGDETGDGSPRDRWRIAMAELSRERGDGVGGRARDGLRDYAFGIDPAKDRGESLLSPRVERDEHGGAVLVVRHPLVPTATDLSYRVEASRDLREWIDVTELVDVRETGRTYDGGHWRAVAIPAALSGGEPFRFARVSVVQRPSEIFYPRDGLP